MSTTKNPTQFALLSRILHWLMAALLVAMLFIGVSMVSSFGRLPQARDDSSAAGHC